MDNQDKINIIQRWGYQLTYLKDINGNIKAVSLLWNSGTVDMVFNNNQEDVKNNIHASYCRVHDHILDIVEKIETEL